MAETLHIVTSCTNRKSHDAGERRIGDLIRRPLAERVEAWWARLGSPAESPMVRASDLYVGPHWRRSCEAVDLAEGSGVFADVQLHVMSAGYGLVPSCEPLRPYAATFSTESDDCVLGRGDRGDAWWDELSRFELPSGAPRSIRSLAEQDNDATIVVVGSTQYMRAVAQDVIAASRLAEPERVWIVCGGRVPTELENIAVALDGTKAEGLQARMVDLAAAATAHLARSAGEHRFRLSEASRVLEEIEASTAPSARRKARTASDQEVTDFITRSIAGWEESRPPTKTALLRLLRANEDFACEQKRFGRLYAEALEARRP